MSATTFHESGYESQSTVCNLGPIDWIPSGEGRTFQVGRDAIAVYRSRDGNLWATQALCPHRSGLLADGITGSGHVVCPLHSYKFSLVTGEPSGYECEALKVYPVSLSESGDILLMLDNEFEDAPLYEQSQRSACSPFGIAND